MTGSRIAELRLVEGDERATSPSDAAPPPGPAAVAVVVRCRSSGSERTKCTALQRVRAMGGGGRREDEDERVSAFRQPVLRLAAQPRAASLLRPPLLID